MIKNSLKKRITIILLSLFLLLIFYLIPNQNIKESKQYENNFNNVYLLNNNLLIQTKDVSHSNDTIEKAKEIINSLKENSKIATNNNLKALLPKDTKILDISYIDNIIKINFSNDFYNTTNEEKLIEALIYSLTELDNVDGIMIFIEGNELLELPHSKKILPSLLTRDYGINKIYDITTLNNINEIRLYYYTELNNDYKITPVTLFSNDSKDKIEIIIKNLKSGLSYQSDLVSFLNYNAELLDYEIEENKVKLNFSNALLSSFYSDKLTEEVKYAISSSIKETLNIDQIDIFIEGNNI